MTLYLIKVKDMPLFAKKENDGWVGAMNDPSVFPNKKKAKRILKRLNKYHGGNWMIVKY